MFLFPLPLLAQTITADTADTADTAATHEAILVPKEKDYSKFFEGFEQGQFQPVIDYFNSVAETKDTEKTEEAKNAKETEKAKETEEKEIAETSKNADKADKQLNYLVAYAYWRLHKFEEAYKYALRAAQSDYVSPKNYPTTKELLERIQSLRKLRPPRAKLENAELLPFNVYAADTEWFRSVAPELSKFPKQVQKIAGQNLPFVSFFIFENQDAYRLFYKKMFDSENTPGQDGTATSNVVVLCETTRDGRANGRHVISWRRGLLLHEYCHAVCRTKYGATFIRNMPRWLEESIADQLAAPYYGRLFRWYESNLLDPTKGKPPTYNEMKQDLYANPPVCYSFARQMLLEMFKNSRDAKNKNAFIALLLEHAQRLDWNFDQAIKDKCGLEPHTLYDLVIQKYWSKTKEDKI